MAVRECQLRLSLSAAEAADDPATRRRLESLGLVAPTNARGFFQIAGVPAGVYELLAECEGYAPAQVAPIEVVEGLEAQLDGPLLVGRPLQLAVAVVPPVDPYGEPWTLLLDRRRGSRGAPTRTQRGKVDAEGVWVARDLAPAEYHLWVLGSGDERWAERQITLAAGSVSELIEVPVVEVRGTAVIGEDPITGTFWFGGRHGSKRIPLPVDLEGRFEGYLPEEGTWWVEWVENRDDWAGVLVGEVEVRKRQGKTYAEVEIELPGTRLRGEVVTEDGQPVEGAWVSVTTFQRSQKLGRLPGASSRTAADGSFEVLALPPGLTTVTASKESSALESDTQLVTLAEQGEGSTVRLIARAKRSYRGQVVGGSGPVAGARIHAFADLLSSAGTSGEEAVSGPDGSFRLSVRGSATWLYFVVSAPGKATRLARMAADPARPIVLELSDHGGDLVLHLPGGPRGLEALGRTVLLYGDAFLHAAMLSLVNGQPGQLGGQGSIHLRDLEPGLYRLCTGPGVFSQVRQGAEPPRGSCVDGLVQPFSTLELAVPGSAPPP
ncbi:MAG TPA: carboxypeptidase-like regulatory domain-containing protein [Thermoanaerobaculia bacterium]|nr:carboxypeptidase-like regulatory domain-containing protein [Thermoanaerobaculia bacterium]